MFDAYGTGGFHICHFFDLQNLSSHNSRDRNPLNDGQSQKNSKKSCAKNNSNQNNKKKGRKCVENIDDAHEKIIESSTDIARKRTKDWTSQERAKGKKKFYRHL